MRSTNSLRLLIQSVGSEATWKHISTEDFEQRFLIPAFELSEAKLSEVIQSLDRYTFNCWTKKLWTEQDIPPSQNFNAYERTVPIMELLKRSLLVRLVIEEDATIRQDIQQQLGLLSLILSGPTTLSRLTGLPEKEEKEEPKEKEEKEEPSPEELAEFRKWKRNQKET